MHEPAIDFPYSAILESRSADELQRLSIIKRFTENLSGDASFRRALSEHQHDIRPVLAAYDLDLDPERLRPLFDRGYASHRFEHADSRWPDAMLWDNFIRDKLRHRDALRAMADTRAVNPRFDAWRRRQVRRCASELGVDNESIVHAVASYELSVGCTIGCWFCGISAAKFSGHFAYTDDNARLWRGVVGSMAGRLGRAAGTGFCYWATDPSDNPDYLAFIEDHLALTGMLPQTTTAAPLRDIARTRRMLALGERHGSTINRFSILTTPVLRRVFAAFTPRELLGVEMVMQQKDALAPKSLAGRAGLDAASAKGEVGKTAATIACVTGFLINMSTRRVRLVSPTRSSEEWPDGYRVFDEGRFETIADFGTLIDAMIDRNMAEAFADDHIVRFRPDLQIMPTPDGFVARTDVMQQTYRHPRFGRQLGEMLREGRHSYADILARIGAQQLVFDVLGEVQGLLDEGLLDDCVMAAISTPTNKGLTNGQVV